jgi:hypothetical protein
VLDPPPASCCLESAQLPCPHGFDERFVKIRARVFDNLKPDHTSAPRLAVIQLFGYRTALSVVELYDSRKILLPASSLGKANLVATAAPGLAVKRRQEVFSATRQSRTLCADQRLAFLKLVLRSGETANV